MISKQIKEKFNTVFGGPRIPLHQKELRYNKKVLVGQWFEESQKFLRHDFPRETIYQTEYVSPNVTMEGVEANRNIMFDCQINSLGEPKVLVDLDYATNYATLYDLTYNRAVKELLSDDLRKYSAAAGGYAPQRDYTLNHVGGVNKGLLACKKDEWSRDVNVEETMYLTSNKRDFVTHNPLGHKIYKKMPVDQEAAALPRLKVDTADYGSRDEAICFCVDHPKVCWVEPRNPQNILPGL